MKVNSKKWILISIIMALLVLSSCAPKTAPAPEEPIQATEALKAPDTQTAAKPIKAVVLLEGPLADTGWNTSCWKALQELGNKYGWEVSYQDNVNTDNMVDLLRGYGQQRFDLVFGPGWLWAEPMQQIAPEFPKTSWFNINQHVEAQPNMFSNGWITGEAGYFLGILAASMSETKKIGFIGGTESPIIAYDYEQMKKAAQEIDPSIEFSISYVGSWADPAKAKELAKASIEAGADIIVSVTSGGDLGVHEAVREAETPVMFIGWIVDNCQYLPDNTIVSLYQVPGDLLAIGGEAYQAGTLKPGYTAYGFKDGAQSLLWCNDNVPADVKQKVEDAVQQYKDGKLKIETTTDI